MYSKTTLNGLNLAREPLRSSKSPSRQSNLTDFDKSSSFKIEDEDQEQ